jgi:hypothetical protein
MAITSKEESLQKEEDKVKRFQMASMEVLEALGDEKKVQFYKRLLDYHGTKVDELIDEIASMKKQKPFAVANDGKK